jgi:hypothetical protein
MSYESSYLIQPTTKISEWSTINEETLPHYRSVTQIMQPTSVTYESTETMQNQTAKPYWSGSKKECSESIVANKILQSTSNPIELTETEAITVNNHSGIFANKQDIVNWKGCPEFPLESYELNEDLNPEIIRKKCDQDLLYKQEITVKYLRPPTPPTPGKIVIREDKSCVAPPAPPICLRQIPPRPQTPPPIVFREAPPKPPPFVDTKYILIRGKRIPPPPRKIIIERLAPLPAKPQNIIVERWLPYREQKRRVIYEGSTETCMKFDKTRNVIIQWESPRVQVTKEVKNLGIFKVDPVDYVQKYGNSLITHGQMPEFIRNINPMNGVTLASQYTPREFMELEGDINALSLINLENERLSMYKNYLNKQGQTGIYEPIYTFDNVFSLAKRNIEGMITIDEAKRILFILNEKLIKKYDNYETKKLVEQLDPLKTGFIEFVNFKKAILTNNI